MQNTAEKSKYFWVIFLGLLLHMLAEFFFLYIDHTVMASYNLVSIIVFAWSLYYVRRNEYVAVLVCFAEPMVFCIFGVLSFGWGYDIQNWIIVFCLLSLIVPFQRKRPFYVLAILNGLVYCGLFLWAKMQPDGVLDKMELFFAGFSVFSVFFAIFFAERMQSWSKIMELFTLQSRINSMEQIIDVDELTGLLTRRKMNAILAEIDNYWPIKSKNLFLVFIDIDFFKKVNDTWGHDAGDMVLEKVAQILKRELRATDFIARWGGEEFVAIMQPAHMNETLDAHKITAVLERVRREIENARTDFQGTSIQVTATFGGACAEDFSNTTELLAAADKQMYLGKKSGRNRVCIA